MDFTKLKKLTIGGVELKQLFIGGIHVWKSGYKNWARFSTESDGKTIYNGGKGYKDGYRIRSGGAEGAQENASCTGFIPAVAGDVIGLGGATYGTNATANAINVYNAGHTALGQVTESYANNGYGIFADGTLSNWNKGTHKDSCYYWTVPSGADIAFVRVTGKTHGNGSKMIVTVNEEIT